MATLKVFRKGRIAAALAVLLVAPLVQADVLPALGQKVWDTSGLLSTQSLLGETLKTLVGYDDRPAGMQVVFYVGTAILIVVGMKVWGAPRGAVRAA